MGNTGVLLIYAVNCGLSLAWIQVMLPETQGLTLEEIQLALQRDYIRDGWFWGGRDSGAEGTAALEGGVQMGETSVSEGDGGSSSGGESGPAGELEMVAAAAGEAFELERRRRGGQHEGDHASPAAGEGEGSDTYSSLQDSVVSPRPSEGGLELSDDD